MSLELLIEEQRRDDTYEVRQKRNHFSLDSRSWLRDVVGTGVDGEVVCNIRKRHSDRWADFQHGTLSAYTNHKCRCASCRAKNASYRRDNYIPKPCRTGVCPVCEATFETNQDAKVYCSQRCNKFAWNSRQKVAA